MPKPSTATNDPKEAGDWLGQGKLLAYPSESVWGIGCDAFCKTATNHLLTLKNRPISKGLIVLTDNAQRLLPLLDPLPLDNATLLARLQTTHKDQAQTWVINTAQMPTYLTGDHQSLAIRVTPHPLLQRLCQTLVSKTNPYGFLVSTSCNLTDRPPAQTLDEAYGYFGNEVHYLMGDTLGFDKPSKINDLITGETLRW